MEKLRIDDEDDGFDAINKVNDILAPYHVMFVDDEQDDDGYVLFALETKEQP